MNSGDIVFTALLVTPCGMNLLAFLNLSDLGKADRFKVLFLSDLPNHRSYFTARGWILWSSAIAMMGIAALVFLFEIFFG